MTTPLTCQTCGKETPSRQTKKLAGTVFCRPCWDKLYVTRAIMLPIITPVDPTQKAACWRDLRASWHDCAQMANWAISEMSRADGPRKPGQVKLEKFAQPYLYPQARQLWPELASASVVALLNLVQSKYREARFAVVWRMNEALPRFKDPQPLQIPAAAWSASYLSETERVRVFSANIRGTRYELRLRGGPHFRRQLREFDLFVDGTALQCEAAIYQRGDVIFAKLVGWFPRQQASNTEKEIVIATSEESLLVGARNENELWRYNADHAKRWVSEHSRRLLRLHEDSKIERRTGEIGDPEQHRQRLVFKHRNRMDSLCHQASAAAVKHASRMRATKLILDLRSKSYIESFPWFKLSALIEQKAHAAGMTVEKTTETDEGKPCQTNPEIPTQGHLASAQA